MSESYLKGLLKAALDERGIPNWAAGAGPYHPTGIADRIGCLPPHGRMLWIEAKNPNGKGRTKEQQKSKAKIFAAAGALVIISCNLREILMTIDAYLATVKPAEQESNEPCTIPGPQPSMRAC